MINQDGFAGDASDWIPVAKVVHCKKEPYDIYIGRPSKWGNPFEIGKDGSREEVILKYFNYLIQNNSLLDQILEIDGKVLGCWCRPKDCHGDAILNVLNAEKMGCHYVLAHGESMPDVHDLLPWGRKAFAKPVCKKCSAACRIEGWAECWDLCTCECHKGKTP